MWASQYDVAKTIKVTGNEEVLKGMETYYKEILQRNHLNQYEIKWNDRGPVLRQEAWRMKDK